MIKPTAGCGWSAYPEFFDELSDFFADRDEVEKIAAPAARRCARRPRTSWRPTGSTRPRIPTTSAGSAGYEVIDRLGRGGMGVVFKGFDAALNRYVAIKVLAPQWASDADRPSPVHPRGAGAAAAISHPHVITIHAVGEWNAAGRSWSWNSSPASRSSSGSTSGGPLELQEILRIGMQVASGLAAPTRRG